LQVGLGKPFSPFLLKSKEPSPNKLPIKGSFTSLGSGITGSISSCLGDLNLPLLSLVLLPSFIGKAKQYKIEKPVLYK